MLPHFHLWNPIDFNKLKLISVKTYNKETNRSITGVRYISKYVNKKDTKSPVIYVILLHNKIPKVRMLMRSIISINGMMLEKGYRYAPLCAAQFWISTEKSVGSEIRGCLSDQTFHWNECGDISE